MAHLGGQKVLSQEHLCIVWLSLVPQKTNQYVYPPFSGALVYNGDNVLRSDPELFIYIWSCIPKRQKEPEVCRLYYTHIRDLGPGSVRYWSLNTHIFSQPYILGVVVVMESRWESRWKCQILFKGPLDDHLLTFSSKLDRKQVKLGLLSLLVPSAKVGAHPKASETLPWKQSLFQVLVAQSCPTLCYPMHPAWQAPLSMEFSRQEYWSR